MVPWLKTFAKPKLGMAYRPKLSEETCSKLEKSKEILKQKEEEDWPDTPTEEVMWRRGNQTFDIDWIIQMGLEMFNDQWSE